MIFSNRYEAGHRLGEALSSYKSPETIVMGLARGGVPVASEVAKKLDAPLDVLLVRKLGVPVAPEFGFGAIAPGVVTIDKQTVVQMELSEGEVNEVVEKEKAELKRRLNKYRGGREEYDLRKKVVIVVDDGIATGVSSRAAIEFARMHEAKELVLATPVCPRDAYLILKEMVDKFVCLHIPEYFGAVGEWYMDFGQTEDDEVIKLLKRKDR